MLRPLLVKICGLSTPETLDAAIAAGADMIGLVHYAPSPRHVSLETMAILADRARGRASIVALLVAPDDDLVEDVVRLARPDYLQLHGKETPDRVKAVRSLGVPVIKALGIGSADDLAAARAHDGLADLLLFDAKPPKDATRPGGLGAAFDWSLLEGARFTTPFLLSGGLGPTNIREAVTRVSPFGVDVSSGVESAPGVKDVALIGRFVSAAREAAAATGR